MLGDGERGGLMRGAIDSSSPAPSLGDFNLPFSWIPKKCVELYTEYTKKVHGTQLGHHNCIPIPLCVTEIIQTISPDIKRKYIGFCYANGKMIN